MNNIENKIRVAIKRIPSKEIERLRVALLQKWKEKKGTAVIFPKPKIKKYPGVYFFGLITNDWTGAAGATLGVITESKWDIATHWGLSLYYERQKVGIIVVGIGIKNEEELRRFLEEKNKLKEKLSNVCIEGWRKSVLLVHDIKKIQKCEDVMKIIKEAGEFTEGVAEEVTKFFASRGEEYLSERSPKTLADIILTNYKFIHMIRNSGGEPQVEVKHLKTKRGLTLREELTGISIGCYEDDFSLLLALDAIRDVVPDYTVKYNKQFITDDKISIYRIEIDGFHPEKRIEKSIIEKMRTMKFEKERVREVSRGFEHYGKAIIPKLIKEYTLSKIPQVYIAPELTSPGFIHFKLIVVKEFGSPWTDKYIAELDKIKGITVLGCESPKVYQDSEVGVFDLRAKADAFTSIEAIYSIIRKSLTNVIGDFRDFGKGMRELDTDKFAKVRRKVKGVGLNLLREFYYGIQDFYRVSGAEEEIIELVKLGVKLARGKVTHIRWSEVGSDTTDSHCGKCTLIGIASKENILPQVLKMLEDYETVVSKIQLGILNILLIRAEEQGRALPQEKLLSILHPLAKLLKIPEKKLGI